MTYLKSPAHGTWQARFTRVHIGCLSPDNLSNSNSMEHGEEIDRDDISSPGERSNASQLGRAGTVRKNINR